jgi:hypothetical protein
MNMPDWRAAATATALVLLPALVHGQAGGPAIPAGGGGPRYLKIDKITATKLPTPEYEVKRVSLQGAQTKQWFQITVKYQTAPEWMDELNFKYYALVKNKEAAAGQAPYICFSGDVAYVNVEKGSHESDIYVHPSTLKRFGDVEAVAVQVFYKGQLVGMEMDPPSSQRWWEQVAPQPGYLLNRMETPFAMINFDNYEAIKATGPGR